MSHKNDDQRHHIDFKCTLSYLVVIQFGLDLAKWSFDMDIKGIDGTILFQNSHRRTTSIFSCASAKAERSLSSLSCMCVYVDQNKGTPQKWHIHWEFLDFKSRFGFTTKIYPRLIFIFKWMPSNNSDTNLFLILQNYLKPFQQWMPLSSPNHSAN